MEYNSEKKEIILNKELSDLDRFVLDFLRILEKHSDYIVISGYISILFGRSRATEDIDVYMNHISFEGFNELYNDLRKNGFWCLNAEDVFEVFSYLNDGLAIRFAKGNSPIPNFEIKFPKREIDKDTFNDFIKVKFSEGEIKISSFERHIAFKRYYLKSDKDIEDALHIEELFRDKIDYNKINKLREIVENIKN